jgi:7-carboxy-7-deazaguanine synthase
MSQDNLLCVSEIFYSLQGEGSTAGKPSVFLRLAGCNLLCKSEKWECDTLALWQKGKWMSLTEVKEKILGAIKDVHQQVLHPENIQLVVTGGEPLLQSESLVSLLEILPFSRVEIETNGTQKPLHFKERAPEVLQYNISPKLSSSGVDRNKRTDIPTLAFFNILKYRSSIFKFVLFDSDDVTEALFIIKEVDIPQRRVYFMPAGKSQDELEQTKRFVWQTCMDYGFNYSPRLQIDLFNTKTGV